MKEFAKMHLCSSKFCLALLLSYTLAAPVLAQGMKERACQIIQADSYENWVERLISYEEILDEAANDPLSEEETRGIARAVEDNWRRHLFAPNATSTSDRAELRFAKRKACSSAMRDIVIRRSNMQLPSGDGDLMNRVEAVLGPNWRQRGDIGMMMSLLIRFGPTCDDFRTTAISKRANDISKLLNSPACPIGF